MSVVFAHDHVFVNVTGEGIFSPGKLPYTVLAKYTEFLGPLVVLGRIRSSDSAAGLSRSDGRDVEVRAVPSLSGIVSSIRNRRQARRVVRAAVEGADVVIARLPSEIGSAAFDEARALGKLIVVEVVGCPKDALWHHGSPVGKLYALPAMLGMKRRVARADFVLYVTQRFLQGRYPSEGVSEHASDVQIDAPSRDVLEQRLRRIVATPKRLGLIGSLETNYKGIDVAVDSVAQLRKRGWNLTLHVLGGGNSRRWIDYVRRRGMEGQVSFDGIRAAGSEVNRWLDGIDLYLQPSRTEGLPRALVEAMSRGCPCIGTAVGGIPELLSPQALAKPGSVKELSARIAEFASSPALRRENAVANFNRATEYAADRIKRRRDGFWDRVRMASITKRHLPKRSIDSIGAEGQSR